MAEDIEMIDGEVNKLYRIETGNGGSKVHYLYLLTQNQNRIKMQSNGLGKPHLFDYRIDGDDWPIKKDQMIPTLFDKQKNRVTYTSKVVKITELSKTDQDDECLLFKELKG